MLNEFMKLARDHYWDSLEPQKELIFKHLESIASMATGEAAQHGVHGTACAKCGGHPLHKDGCPEIEAFRQMCRP